MDPTDADRIRDHARRRHEHDHAITAQTPARVTLPIGQMYHVAVDNQVPYHDLRQHAGRRHHARARATRRRPARTCRHGGGTAVAAATRWPWEHGLGGCESGFTLPDPTDTEHRLGDLLRQQSDPLRRTDQDGAVGEPVAASRSIRRRTRSKYRCHWTAPLAIDPFDHNTVYYGCQMILRTTNGGESWTRDQPRSFHQDPAASSLRAASSATTSGSSMARWSSPSRLRRSRRASSGPAPTTARSGTRTTAARSGTTSPKNITGLPAWGVVSKIEPSHFDAGTAYICVDFHLMDNRDPWIYKTTDFGTDVDQDQRRPAQGSAGLCAGDRRESQRKGMLFAGTGQRASTTRWTTAATGSS